MTGWLVAEQVPGRSGAFVERVPVQAGTWMV